ncbi:MAG: phosphatase PAP2 family protein [Deltaproteobacteria bacterium]|nr:phosphatase PAP2 family protein [Deltaproteobacteria bacterium]
MALLCALLSEPSSSTHTATATFGEKLHQSGLPELGFAVGLGAGSLAVKLFTEPSSGWRRDFWFDALVSERIAVRPELRETLSDVSDVIDRALAAYPFAVDSLALYAFGRIDGELALQILELDAVALLASTLVVTAVKDSLSRARPDVEPCADGGFDCRSRASRESFPSGHAATAFTAAGLVCAHQELLQLYGSELGAVACLSAISLASANAVLRVASARHHPTDVLAGALIGAAMGYLLPRALLEEDESHPPKWVLSLGLGGGIASVGPLAASLGGVRVTADGRLGSSFEVRSSLGAAGGPDGYLAEGVLEGLATYGPVGLGVFGGYSAVEIDGAARSLGRVGPRLSLDLGRGQAALVRLVVGVGLPVDGAETVSREGTLRIDLLRHFAVSFTTATFGSSGDRTAVFLSSIGGRLPL